MQLLRNAQRVGGRHLFYDKAQEIVTICCQNALKTQTHAQKNEFTLRNRQRGCLILFSFLVSRNHIMVS